MHASAYDSRTFAWLLLAILNAFALAFILTGIYPPRSMLWYGSLGGIAGSVLGTIYSAIRHFARHGMQP